MSNFNKNLLYAVLFMFALISPAHGGGSAEGGGSCEKGGFSGSADSQSADKKESAAVSEVNKTSKAEKLSGEKSKSAEEENTSIVNANIVQALKNIGIIKDSSDHYQSRLNISFLILFKDYGTVVTETIAGMKHLQGKIKHHGGAIHSVHEAAEKELYVKSRDATGKVINIFQTTELKLYNQFVKLLQDNFKPAAEIFQKEMGKPLEFTEFLTNYSHKWASSILSSDLRNSQMEAVQLIENTSDTYKLLIEPPENKLYQDALHEGINKLHKVFARIIVNALPYNTLRDLLGYIAEDARNYGIEELKLIDENSYTYNHDVDGEVEKLIMKNKTSAAALQGYKNVNNSAFATFMMVEYWGALFYLKNQLKLWSGKMDSQLQNETFSNFYYKIENSYAQYKTAIHKNEAEFEKKLFDTAVHIRESQQTLNSEESKTIEEIGFLKFPQFYVKTALDLSKKQEAADAAIRSRFINFIDDLLSVFGAPDEPGGNYMNFIKFYQENREREISIIVDWLTNYFNTNSDAVTDIIRQPLKQRMGQTSVHI